MMTFSVHVQVESRFYINLHYHLNVQLRSTCVLRPLALPSPATRVPRRRNKCSKDETARAGRGMHR